MIVHNAEAMLREARAAHARGWAMIPLTGKRAAKKVWQAGPAASLDEVVEWARVRNVGARTGQVSGIVVIDDDTDDLSAATQLDLPLTVTAVSGGGGRHYYFKAPTVELRNSASKLARNVDVRANGGYIVLPGSTHPDSGELYRWLEGHDPDSIELAPFPMALMDLLRPKRTRPRVTAQEQMEQRACEILRDVCADVQYSAEGVRNDTLNMSAFTAGGLVAAGALALGYASDELRAAGLASGLDAAEVDATLQSGLAAGQAEPFDRTTLLASAGIVLQDAEADRPDPPRDASGRPEIILVGGELPKIAFACEQALLSRPKPLIFQRGGVLVRIVRADPVSMRDVQDVTPGRLQTVDVTQDWLRAVLTSHAAFYRLEKRSGEYSAVDCPTSIAKVLLELRGSWKFPSLLTITNAPTLRADGSVIELPGYDRATTIYFDPGKVEFPSVPAVPTRDDALGALAQLKFVLKDFPFETPADRSVLLAAILTALVRPSLRAAPLFGISAPKMASGKSLLGDIIAMIATGRVGQAMPQGKDEEEDRKRLLAILKEGELVAVIDNVDRPMGGGAMCAALTQEVYRDRVLGVSKTASFPTCVTWIATGNNLLVEGDLTTRVLICRLDAKVERPEEREFDIDPRLYVTEHRGDLVVAGLTVLRAYIVAGRPKQDIPQFGRFEDFSDIVRAALVWAGESDPCEVRKRIEDADPERQIHTEVMAAWLEVFSSASLTAGDVVRHVERAANGVDAASRLREVLCEIAMGTGGAISSRRLGNWLSSKRDRIEGGMRFMQIGQRHRSILWAVVAPDMPLRAKSLSAAAQQTHQTRQTHISAPERPDSHALSGEFDEFGEFTSPSSEIDWQSGAPVYLDDRCPGESGNAPESEAADAANNVGLTAVAAGWPSGPCYQCRSTRFWRLKNEDLAQPGDPRCARCYAHHPAEQLVEFFELEGGAA